jgi:hypothetical protein
MKNLKKVKRSLCKESTDEENLSLSTGLMIILLPIGLFITFIVFLTVAWIVECC